MSSASSPNGAKGTSRTLGVDAQRFFCSLAPFDEDADGLGGDPAQFERPLTISSSNVDLTVEKSRHVADIFGASRAGKGQRATPILDPPIRDATRAVSIHAGFRARRRRKTNSSQVAESAGFASSDVDR